MSGSEATGAEAATTTESGAAPEAGAGAPSAAPAPAPDPFDDLPADQAVFDRGYVEKIRKQGQRYHDEAKTAREQLSGYDDVFGVYEQEDRDVWLSLARQWATDPNGAAAIMQQIANAVLGEGTEQAPVAPSSSPPPASTGSQDGAPGTMTAEQIAELVQQQLAQADYERRQADMVESIYSTMRTAGVEPKSAEGMAVLWLANNETDGDIDKALELHKSSRQKAIDEYVSGRSGKPLPAPANGIPANASAEPIKNLDDARKAAEAYIRSQSDAR